MAISHSLAAPVPRARTRFRSLLGWLVTRDARYRDARHLEELSDHILRDIGLTRDELRRGRRAD